MQNSKFHGTIPVEVTGNMEISEGVFILSFRRVFEFIPGQVVAISVIKNHSSPRLYSICSGTDEPEISILFNVVPGGELTELLSKMACGDTIFCSMPHGSFLGNDKPAFWIATGTGIAPYISMLRSGLGKGNFLIHGSRRFDGFYFSDEISGLLDSRYIRCCSGEKGEGVYNGRLTGYLSGQESLPYDYRYYLCGRAEMVVETRDLLISKGVPYTTIVSEIYF